MSDLPIRKIPGIGNVTESHLNGLGIIKCKDIFELKTEIFLLFKERTFHWLVRAGLGIARNEHEEDEGPYI